MSLLLTSQVFSDLVQGLCTSKRKRHNILRLPRYLEAIITLIRAFAPGIGYAGFERTNIERMWHLTASASGDLFCTDYRNAFLILSSTTSEKKLLKKPKGFHNPNATVGNRLCVDGTNTVYFRECVGLGKEVIRRFPLNPSSDSLCKRFSSARPKRVFMFQDGYGQRTFCCTSKGELYFCEGREVLRWDFERQLSSAIGLLPRHVDGAFDMCYDAKNNIFYFLTISTAMADLENPNLLGRRDVNELFAIRFTGAANSLLGAQLYPWDEEQERWKLHKMEFGIKCCLYYIPGTNRTVFNLHEDIFLIHSYPEGGSHMLKLAYNIPQLSRGSLSPRRRSFRKSASGLTLSYIPKGEDVKTIKKRKWSSVVFLSTVERFVAVYGTDAMFFFDPM